MHGGRKARTLSWGQPVLRGVTNLRPHLYTHPHLQVCVPRHMAVVLTYPERVTQYNIEKLRRRVLNGGQCGGEV